MVSLNCHTADEEVPIHWYPIIATPMSDPSWVKWLGYDWSDPVLRCSRCCGHPGRHRRQHPTPGRRLLREGHPDAPGILSLLQHHQAFQLSWSRQRRFPGLHPWNKVFHSIIIFASYTQKNYIRFISMAWVVVGHGYNMFQSGQIFSSNWLVSWNHSHSGQHQRMGWVQKCQEYKYKQSACQYSNKRYPNEIHFY